MDTTGAPSGNDFFAADPPAPAPEPAAVPQPNLTPAEPAPSAEPAVTPVAPAAQPPAPAPEPPSNMVPLSTMLEERHRRQAAEAAYAAAQREAQLREALILQQYQRQQPPPQPPIDPVAEPERAFQALQADAARREQTLRQEFGQRLEAIQQQRVHDALNMSERAARAQFGNDAVDKARDAALAQGVNQIFVNQPDPYAALVQWHRAQELAAEVGADPAAYRAKIAQQERDRVLAELKQGRQPSNIPPSVSAATNSASPSMGLPSDREFFNSTFGRRTKPPGQP